MFNKWIIVILAFTGLSACQSVCEEYGTDAAFTIMNYPYDKAPEDISIIVNNGEKSLSVSGTTIGELYGQQFLSIWALDYMDPDKVQHLIIDGKLYEISSIKTYKSVRDWRCFIDTFQVNSCFVQPKMGNIEFDYQCGVDK